MQIKKHGSIFVITILFTLITIGFAGCNGGNPIEPAPNLEFNHSCTWFNNGTQTVFGTVSSVACDVDLASVVWGSTSAGSSDLGTVVDFNDGTSWVAAIAIDETDDDEIRPVIRFLSDDGESMSDIIEVPIADEEDFEARLPRIDCTYNGEDMVQAAVTFRYSGTGYSYDVIVDTWNVSCYIMDIEYQGNDEWELDGYTVITTDQMEANGNMGKTHPDIAYDQYSGDIYCAWTELRYGYVGLVYQRYNSQTGWTLSSYSLEHTYRDHDPWFVSIDTGLVAGLPGLLAAERFVGFAYTGVFGISWPEDDLWGCRAVVGWWNINTGPSDGSHPAQIIIVNRADFDPEDPHDNGQWGNKYETGMARVDIGCDDAAGHGGALVFMQDTCDEGYGDYEVYGISSLYYAGFTWISDPDAESFEMALLPSLAIHQADGTDASVTFHAREEDTDDWDVWATLWAINTGANAVASPTEVDEAGEGYFILDPDELLTHDWGTASNLAIAGDNNEYWAAWSDMDGEDEPSEIHASLGFTDS